MINQVIKNKKVVVAMSGGVDSSVAAAILKKQGYDVVGVFMRFWHETRTVADGDADGRGNSNSCCSAGAEQAARDVATKLKIPFYVLSVQKEFKKAVVDYFLAEQKRGRTPNPCVVCNKKIKFGLLFEKALAMGADFVATGHYARLSREIPNSKKQAPSKFRIPNLKLQTGLFKAKDEDKDQSYFLYTLMQEKLSRVLFPVGDYKKEKIYALAKKWRLPYRQGESFDLCFVANDADSFLRRYIKMRKGQIRDLKENILGLHEGLALYTVGQRKNISLQQGPWWVVEKDAAKNILYVSNEEKDLYGKKLIVENVNWASGEAPKLPIKAWVKIRYKSEAAISQIAQRQSQIVIKFVKAQRAITPGQSVVFYNKDGELLGGGVIK